MVVVVTTATSIAMMTRYFVIRIPKSCHVLLASSTDKPLDNFGALRKVASSLCSRRSFHPRLRAFFSLEIAGRDTSAVVSRIRARLASGIPKPRSMWVIKGNIGYAETAVRRTGDIILIKSGRKRTQRCVTVTSADELS